MIEQYFATKRVIAKPIHTPHQGKVYDITHQTGAPTPFESTRAEKMGLTIEV